jgi:CRP-like cAMP-binding protein
MALSHLLLQNPVFSYLSEDERNNLAELAISRKYPKNHWISHHGDHWPYLFIVESGSITAVKESSEGRRLILFTMKSGEVFWGMGFFQTQMPMQVALISKRKSEVHLWSQESLMPILFQNGRVSWELARLMIERMKLASDMVEGLAFQPVAGRLAGLILSHYGDSMGDYTRRDLTLDEMAARIGSTREMVCRLLYRFSDDGAVQINRTEFMISDQEKLEGFARKVKG